mgnify:CR=1 FL=1
MSSLLSTGFFGLSVGEILLHMINLCVLFIAMSFLLYKPVKKIIYERRNNFTQALNDRDKLLEEIEENKNKMAQVIKKAQVDEVNIINSAKIKAEKEGAEIIDKAKEDATLIIEKAKTDAKNQKKKFNQELSEIVPDLAIEMASKILQREVNKNDNDKIIKDIIKDWKE